MEESADIYVRDATIERCRPGVGWHASDNPHRLVRVDLLDIRPTRLQEFTETKAQREHNGPGKPDIARTAHSKEADERANNRSEYPE